MTGQLFYIHNFVDFSDVVRVNRAANSTRIRESILVMICAASTYENQFLSLNPIVIAMVAIRFDSRKLNRNCTPG